MPFQTEETETNFQNLLRKRKIDSQFLYDNSFLDDGTSISNLSLKTILDYTRRLITVIVGVCVKTAGSGKNKMTLSPPTHNPRTWFLVRSKILTVSFTVPKHKCVGCVKAEICSLYFFSDPAVFTDPGKTLFSETLFPWWKWSFWFAAK